MLEDLPHQQKDGLNFRPFSVFFARSRVVTFLGSSTYFAAPPVGDNCFAASAFRINSSSNRRRSRSWLGCWASDVWDHLFKEPTLDPVIF
jgi:hypothetical protein